MSGSRKIPFTLSTTVALLLFGAFVVFASPPPTGGYDPGTELDPDCTPGSTDCFVRLGIAIGDNVRDGDAGSILYLDSANDLTQDARFTRDGTTNETVISRTFTSTGDTITTGFFSDDNIIGSGLSGSVFTQFNGTTNEYAIVGTFDFSTLGGSKTTAGIVSGDGADNNTFLLGPTSGAWLLNDVTGAATNLYMDNLGGFNLNARNAGGDYQGFQSDGSLLSWYGDGNTFFIPTLSIPAVGNVLKVDSVSGNDVYMDWTSPSGLALQTDGFTNGEQTLLNLIAGTNINLTDDGLGGITIDATGGSLSLETDGVANGSQTLLNLIAGTNINLTDNGTGSVTIDATGGSLALQTDSVANGSQVLLNLIAGTNINLTDDGLGGITIDATSSNDWSLTGNSGTTAGTNFLGTTDAEDLVLKANGNIMARFYESTGTSLNSVALGGGDALSVNMFVYGLNAGFSATSASASNFIGPSAGFSATSATYSNFFGDNAGSSASAAGFSNFFGRNAGLNATNASSSNFFGYDAGSGAADAGNSNFFGRNAGLNATNANYSNFFGYEAGSGATNALESNFFGYQAGYGATGTRDANFFGFQAGNGATNADYSNFFGYEAGESATSANDSNFFGLAAGKGATSANNSNFFGLAAGTDAVNANNSNFFGPSAGLNATNAAASNFFGQSAGSGATNASNSIFIGQSAGFNDTANNTGNTDDFSILIGKSTSTGGFENSIAIGGSATNTASNQFMIGSATRPIDTTRIEGSASTQCTITTGTGIACTSDERVKTNIIDLTTGTLEKLTNVRTVTYNWSQNPTSKTQIGFLAQNLEQYFPELVDTDSKGMKSVYYAQMTPILVEAIREMNLNIIDLTNNEKPNTWRDALITWLESATNGIRSLVVKDKICIEDQCLTKSDIAALLEMKNSGGNTIIQTPTNPDPTPTSDDEEPAPETSEPQVPPSSDENFEPEVELEPEESAPELDPQDDLAPEPGPETLTE